ncbi:uncharacterized protein LOC135226338 isoform X2 [Macrobrachium nipponense]|uniref:uncharacterized protein LOC135226338 isoform X2 n=1 Tax=Macrobrachium nipponense TaxID=159736 RepID=UPI0030C841AA
MQSFMQSNKILSRVMEHIRVSCSSDQGPPEPESPTPSGSDQQPKPGEIEAATLMRDGTPVIVASMRGGHRCLAADRSECAFVQYLPGQEAYPLPVSESKISESTENGKVSSGRTNLLPQDVFHYFQYEQTLTAGARCYTEYRAAG